MSGTQEQTSFILFTDIYRSSALWERYPDEFSRALEKHNGIVEEAVQSRGGEIMKNLGDGYIALFDRASVCVSAMVDVERGMDTVPALPDETRLQVRLAGHGGPLKRLAVGKGYFGHALNRASRIVQVCHPGQALVSEAVRAHTGEDVDGAKLTDLGTHHLRDLAEPEHLYQLDHPDFALHKFPPLPTLGFRPNNLVYQPNAFIGRERETAELKRMLIGDGRAGAGRDEEAVGAVHEPPSVGASRPGVIVPSLTGNGARASRLGVTVPLRKTHRLVTITAPGGYGKSRLATQLCANLLDYYENGVFEVLLAPVGDAARIVTTTADALGFQFYGRGEPKQQLIDYLREKQMLVSFDNFEHLMEGKDLLGDILQHAPKVSLLVTSREPLRLKAEKVYKLEPLPVAVGRAENGGTGVSPAIPPAANHGRDGRATDDSPRPATAGKPTGEELPEAVQLFLDRATLVKHDFALTAENLLVVNEICEKLDGVPLSIELAAAWADSFTLGELLSEVEHQLELTAKMSDVPERQRSIRASLDWSYNLLTDEQREVVRAVSTFKGGFFFGAAEFIVGRAENGGTGVSPVIPPATNHGRDGRATGSSPAPPRRANLQKNLRKTLAQLSDKGWLFTRESRVGAGLGKTRFFIRDAATHQYAFEKLKESAVGRAENGGAGVSPAIPPATNHGRDGRATDTGPRPATAGEPTEYEQRTLAHAAYFAELIDREGKKLKGHGQLEALKILGVELENIYEAIDTALRLVGRAGNGGAGVSPVIPPAANHGRDGRATSDKIALQEETAGETPAPPLILPFAKHLASYLDIASKWLEGLPWYERMLKRAEKLKDRALQLQASLGVALLLRRLSRYEEAEKEANTARSLAEEAGDGKSLAQALHSLGAVAYLQGCYEDAEKLFKESLQIAREIGDRSGIAASLNGLGVVARLQDRYEEAEKLYYESHQIKREIGDRSGIAVSLNNLGIVAHAQGRYDEAERLHRESLNIKREIGDRWGIAASLNGLGLVAYSQGRYEEAEKLFQESLRIRREIGDRSGIAMSLNNLGIVAHAQGRYDEAERLHNESLKIKREIGNRYGIAKSLNSLAILAEYCGRYEEAEKLYLQALEMKHVTGDRLGVASVTHNLAAVAINLGRLRDARQRLRESLLEFRRMGIQIMYIEAFLCAARLFIKEDRVPQSAVLAFGAERQAKEMSYKLGPMAQSMLDEAMAKLKEALSEDELAELKTRAEAMSLDELTEYALKTLEGLNL